MVERFYGNIRRVKAVDCFHRRASSLMFDQILNVTLPEEKVSTSEVTQGKIEILLRPNSPDSQIQKVEILD